MFLLVCYVSLWEHHSVSPICQQMSLVYLGQQLLEAARTGQDDDVKALMANGAPFTTDWVRLICVNYGIIFRLICNEMSVNAHLLPRNRLSALMVMLDFVAMAVRQWCEASYLTQKTRKRNIEQTLTEGKTTLSLSCFITVQRRKHCM